MEEITNEALMNLVDVSIRPAADSIAGLIDVPSGIINAIIGQNLAEVLGTTNEILFRPEAWTEVEYGAVTLKTIARIPGDTRKVVTNHNVIALVRVLVNLDLMDKANPMLRPLLGAIAVNPSPRT